MEDNELTIKLVLRTLNTTFNIEETIKSKKLECFADKPLQMLADMLEGFSNNILVDLALTKEKHPEYNLVELINNMVKENNV